MMEVLEGGALPESDHQMVFFGGPLREFARPSPSASTVCRTKIPLHPTSTGGAPGQSGRCLLATVDAPLPSQGPPGSRRVRQGRCTP